MPWMSPHSRAEGISLLHQSRNHRPAATDTADWEGGHLSAPASVIPWAEIAGDATRLCPPPAPTPCSYLADEAYQVQRAAQASLHSLKLVLALGGVTSQRQNVLDAVGARL